MPHLTRTKGIFTSVTKQKRDFPRSDSVSSSPGAAAVKNSIPLSPLKPPSADSEQGVEKNNAGPGEEPQSPHVSMETSNLRPETPRAEVEPEDEDEASGPLTISELAYRLAEFQHRFSAARNLCFEIALLPWRHVFCLLFHLFQLFQLVDQSGNMSVSRCCSPCASMLPTPIDNSQCGVDVLFSSPAQSPARMLRELHADPEIQARLEAERDRDRAYERARLATRAHAGGVLSSGLRLLSSNERVNACLLSVARFVAVVMGVLLVTVPTLLLLLESDIDVSFLHEIRQTPEFEQFHYEYYCPLRRWILCKVSMAMENLWSD